MTGLSVNHQISKSQIVAHSNGSGGPGFCRPEASLADQLRKMNVHVSHKVDVAEKDGEDIPVRCCRCRREAIWFSERKAYCDGHWHRRKQQHHPAARQAERMNVHRENGLCACGRPTDGESTRCVACKETHKRSRERHKAQGRCECGRATKEGKATCETCLRKNKNRRQRLADRRNAEMVKLSQAAGVMYWYKGDEAQDSRFNGYDTMYICKPDGETLLQVWRVGERNWSWAAYRMVDGEWRHQTGFGMFSRRRDAVDQAEGWHTHGGGK